jgi:hypothetical protein
VKNSEAHILNAIGPSEESLFVHEIQGDQADRENSEHSKAIQRAVHLALLNSAVKLYYSRINLLRGPKFLWLQ